MVSPFPPLPPPPPPQSALFELVDSDFYVEAQCDHWEQQLFVWAEDIYSWSEHVSEWAHMVVREGEQMVINRWGPSAPDTPQFWQTQTLVMPAGELRIAKRARDGDETLHELWDLDKRQITIAGLTVQRLDRETFRPRNV